MQVFLCEDVTLRIIFLTTELHSDIVYANDDNFNLVYYFLRANSHSCSVLGSFSARRHVSG